MDRESPEVLKHIADRLAAADRPTYQQLALDVDQRFGTTFGTGESMRKFAVKRRLRPSLPVQDLRSAAPTPEQEIGLAKTRIVTIAQRKAHKSEINKQAVVELIIDAFRDIAPTMPPIPDPQIPPVYEGVFEEEEAILSLGDLHTGEELTDEDSGGLGSFDWDTTMVYAKCLLNKIRAIVPRHNYPIPTLNLHALGDMMTGRDIFLGQHNSIDSEEVEQALKCAEFLVWFILELLSIFQRIRFKGVYGNHGRIGKKGETKGFNNWDYLIYRMVEERIKSNPAVSERVTFEIPKAWFLLTEIMGWRYLLMHGEDVNAWNQIPFYGLKRHMRNWSMLLQRFDRAADNNEITERLHHLVGRVGPFDEMEIGHHHTTCYISDTGVKLHINGAWPGGSLFSLRKMGTASIPSQIFRGVSRSASTSWYYDLSLDTPLTEVMHA